MWKLYFHQQTKVMGLKSPRSLSVLIHHQGFSTLPGLSSPGNQAWQCIFFCFVQNWLPPRAPIPLSPYPGHSPRVCTTVSCSVQGPDSIHSCCSTQADGNKWGFLNSEVWIVWLFKELKLNDMYLKRCRRFALFYPQDSVTGDLPQKTTRKPNTGPLCTYLFHWGKIVL